MKEIVHWIKKSESEVSDGNPRFKKNLERPKLANDGSQTK